MQRVSQNLGVSVSTVCRIGKLFETTGNVQQGEHGDRETGKVLTTYDQFLVMELVLDRPGIYLHEVCQELQQTTGTEVSEATICKLFQKCGFTHTKIQHVALQCSEERRVQFRSEMQLYNKDMLVFVDESGADRRDSLRKFGYSLRGKRTMSRKLLYRGRRVSTIAALSVSGMLDYRFVDGKVDGAMFRDFVDRHLLRHLMPFNGTNP